MHTKKTPKLLVQRLKLDQWLIHYEIVVTRQGHQQLLARVASRRAAERRVAYACRHIEVGRRSVRWQPARGLHPWNAAKLCLVPLILSTMLPWHWLGGVLTLICLAVICGLLSSGGRWMAGGEDDR